MARSFTKLNIHRFSIANQQCVADDAWYCWVSVYNETLHQLRGIAILWPCLWLGCPCFSHNRGASAWHIKNTNVHHPWQTSSTETIKESLTTGLSWHGPFNVVGSKNRLLNAAAFHQIIGEHSWAQAVLGVTGHKQQLYQRMRFKGGKGWVKSVTTECTKVT